MSDNKNIPDAKQSWLAAEKMLDRHFRKRKIVKIAASVVVPALIIGFVFWFSNHKDDSAMKHSSNEQELLDVNSRSLANSTNLSDEKSLSSSSNNKNINVPSSEYQNNNRKQNEEKNNSSQNSNSKSTRTSTIYKSKDVTAGPVSKNNSDVLASKSSPINSLKLPETKLTSTTLMNVSKTKTSGNSSSSATSATALTTTANRLSPQSPSNKSHDRKDLSTHSRNSHRSNRSFEKEQEKEHVNNSSIKSIQASPEIYPTVASIEQISFLKNYEGEILVPSTQAEANEKSWPKPLMQTTTRNHISWEAAVYAGAHSINKSIQSSSDWQNYLNHRKTEENSVITPTIGLSVSATKNLFTLSIGAEFSSYGEKTNYYPYSLQDSIITNSSWQTFVSNYTDTDTAYITGNPYLLQTIMQRQDSSYVMNQDTVEASKYDKLIAEKNGVNRISYAEIPIELSICFTKGRAGFGVSGGVSPALLVSQKGNYLRRDSRGVESFSEIKSFRKFMLNARFSADFYYRFSGRAKLLIRPQIKSNLNSVFENSYGVKQKYYSTGILFGISYMLN